MEKLRVLDLFSGIGGFSLGLERTGGFETVAFCEIEAFPRKVLAKHWPDVPCYDDVRTLTAERLAADGIAVDVICGGFPCQDISTAGKGAGLAGERSGLFYEIARLVGELAPRYVVLENVAALLGRGLGDVLGTLASLGYDAEWHCIPASYLGAPHRRDRIWIVAYPEGGECRDVSKDKRAPRGTVNTPLNAGGSCGGHDKPEHGAPLAHPALLQRDGGELHREHREGEVSELGTGSGAVNVADTMRRGRQGQGQSVQPCNPAPIIQGQAIDAFNGCIGDIWRIEPDVGRVANGVPDRAHRLKGLGNAVVPQIPELIGRAILAALQDSRTARPSRACAAGEAFDPRVSPNSLQNVSHDAHYTGDRA